MNIEIHEPELEQRFTRQIQSGQFRDADELLTKALDALEKTTPQMSPEFAALRKKLSSNCATLYAACGRY